MSNSQLITVDVPGLDLALGGGIWAVRRMPGVNASATLLIRGPPGSGKTAFGTLLAGALGRALEGDVAYGCVELLPVELQVQHENLRGTAAREQILVPPFQQLAAKSSRGCCIFADLLELGTEAQAHLGTSVLKLLEDVRHAGGQPRVLVIDSLSEGYQLGSSTPRITADALSKLVAARGLILILLEEIVDSRPSTWSFTSDVVLELAGGEEDDSFRGVPAPFERRVTVSKNRFGPSDAGPHHFEFLHPGLRIFPRPPSYLTSWGRQLLELDEPAEAPDQSWLPGKAVEPTEWPQFRECVTAVHGQDAANVFHVARLLGSTDAKHQPYQGITLFIDFMRQVDEHLEQELHEEGLQVIGAGNPYLSAHRLLALVRDGLGALLRNNMIIEKVLVGDMRSLRSFWNPEGIRRAILTLAAMLRQARIPLVMFETTALQGGTGRPGPAIVDFADVVLDVSVVQTYSASYPVYMTATRTGHRYRWELEGTS